MARAKKTAAAAKSTETTTTTVESVNQTTGEVEVVDLNSRRPQANAYLPLEKGYWPQVGAVWINSNGSLNLKVNPGMSLNGRVQIQARKGFKFVIVPIEGDENLEALSES